jgi:biotin carboxylase
VPRALVTDAGRGSAIAFIRSLSRCGWDVVAADADPRAAGLRSRHACARLVYPSPRTDSDGLVDHLVSVAGEQQIDLIVPVTDDVLLPLVAARERLPERCRLAAPGPDALEVARDKSRTLELARRLGVAAPASALVHGTDEALAAAPALGWPVVVKPATSRLLVPGEGVAALTVSYARDEHELEEQFGRLPAGCAVLLQEHVTGEGHGVELLMSDGRQVAAFQHRRLREVPTTGGASSFRESAELDPVMHAASLRLLGELRWTGLAMVEFKLTARGPVLMEINGRVWGSLPLAVKSGVDFPALLAELYLPGSTNGHGAGGGGYRVGVRSRNLRLEIIWIGSVLRGAQSLPGHAAPRRRDAVRAAARLPNPRDGYDILSLRDLRPGMRELAGVARKLRGAAHHAA